MIALTFDHVLASLVGSSSPLRWRDDAAEFGEKTTRAVHRFVDVERELVGARAGFVERGEDATLDDHEVDARQALLSSCGERVGDDAEASGLEQNCHHLVGGSRFHRFLRHLLSPVIVGISRPHSEAVEEHDSS